MMKLSKQSVLLALWVCCMGCAAVEAEQSVTGWLQWRGPQQNGTSAEQHLPEQWDPVAGGQNMLWSIDLPSRGTPVIGRFNGQDRVIAWGYRGRGADLQEVLMCLDAATGQTLWERTFSDYLSDIIYQRYALGSASIDAETGNVYLMTSPGLFVCLDSNGNMLWQHSMMEEFGRLTFPNGRTGAPAIDGDLVMLNTISTNWGREGPARNRFYAFDKRSGELVWSSTPGIGPPDLKDSSFCMPLFETRGGMRVFYAGLGCGNIVCVNARTGQPLWRYQMSFGGINSMQLVIGDKLIAIHGKENRDDTGRGRMVALDLNKAFAAVEAARSNADTQWPLVLGTEYELWRNNEMSMFTSSPVELNGRIYQVTMSGVLFCVDADSGKTIWKHKIGADQLHASPLVGDGKLYIPTWNDGMYIIRPTDDGPQILDHDELAGSCIGSPSAWNGQVYVHTTKTLYCFGQPSGSSAPAWPSGAEQAGSPTYIQAIPSEVLLRPGQQAGFTLRAAGDQGVTGGVGDSQWSKYIPPTARVRSAMDAEFNDNGELVAASTARLSAGAFEVTADGLKGHIRGRILPSPPYSHDFESAELNQTSAIHGGSFAYPPLPWIGARLKWEVRDVDGNKALVKTLDRVLFMRSMVFIGHPDDSNYTMQADVMTDGSRRVKSDVGVINQRYIIRLRGNNQTMQVYSNLDVLNVSVPFTFRTRVWYHLKTRVDVAADGSGIIRAKAWEKGQDEPDDWTIEVKHNNAHKQGSPGLFGLSPQSLFPVFIDNIKVTPNQ